MCNAHQDQRASQHLQELIAIVKADAGEHTPDEILCQELVKQHLTPRWRDHVETPCEPIALLDIRDNQGQYRPAATLVLRGDPLSSTDTLHYRTDYTVRVAKRPSILDRIRRSTGTRMPMGHQRGHDPNAVMAMTASGLAQIIWREAARDMLNAMEKGKVWPPEPRR